MTSQRVTSAAAMEAALEAHKWDLIISDYSIPGFGGHAALAIYQHSNLREELIHQLQ